MSMVLRDWLDNCSVEGSNVCTYVFSIYCIFVEDFGHFMTFQKMVISQLEELLTNSRFHNFLKW